MPAASVGVISHLVNVGLDEVRDLARAAEAAGADWFGVPDAFWWRDTWILLAEAARVTTRIRLGPMVTNPYLRHPFHTVSAVATLQDLAGDRVFVGLAAGGTEVSAVAGVGRGDAARRISALADLLREVSDGQPLDAATGRRLEVPLRRGGPRIRPCCGRCRSATWSGPRRSSRRPRGRGGQRTGRCRS